MSLLRMAMAAAIAGYTMIVNCNNRLLFNRRPYSRYPNRSVVIDILNNTRNITLRNPRFHLNCGSRSLTLDSELPPDSIDKGSFEGNDPSGGVAGVLVYEAESFTVAIHFSNPIDYNKFPTDLSLELSPGKAHLGSLEDTCARMAGKSYSSSHLDIKFDRGVVVGRNHRSAQLSHGPVKVKATMSSDTKSVVTVVLEEEEGSKEEAQTGNPRGGRHVQEK